MEALDVLKERLRIAFDDLGLEAPKIEESALILKPSHSLSGLLEQLCSQQDRTDNLRARIEAYCMATKAFAKGEPLMPEHLNAALLWLAWCDYRLSGAKRLAPGGYDSDPKKEAPSSRESSGRVGRVDRPGGGVTD